MKFVLMSLLLAESSFAMDALMKKMVHQTNKHVLEAECWGENNKNKYDLAVGAAMEKCMQLAPAIDLVNVLSPNNRFSSLFPSINVKNPFKQFQVLSLTKKQFKKSESYFNKVSVSRVYIEEVEEQGFVKGEELCFNLDVFDWLEK